MSARLGEMFLKVGALTEPQLEQVLSAQAIYGGRLGTNLVEMGLVEEEELARVLSEQLGVPCVEPAELDSVHEPCKGLIPLEMMQCYRVLPIGLDGKRLTLAMADPSDFKAIDEIGFFTGLVIIPRVCPELRLSLALERLYGVKRAMRYVPVEGGVRSRFATAIARPYADAATRELAWGGGAGGAVVPERVSVRELAQKLASASVEGEVVKAVLSYLAGEFDHGAFLRLRHGTVLGGQAIGAGAAEGFAFYAAPIEETRQLRRVVREKRLFLGEMVSDDAEGALIRAMGGRVPGPALFVPVSLNGEVAAVICASDRRGRLGGGVFELQRVAVMTELSFEMLSLKKRIVAG